MNHIFSYAASIPQSLYSTFTENLLPELTAQQKKVIIISSIAISIFTACVLAYRYCSRSAVVPHSPVKSPIKGPANQSHNPVDSPYQAPIDKKPLNQPFKQPDVEFLKEPHHSPNLSHSFPPTQKTFHNPLLNPIFPSPQFSPIKDSSVSSPKTSPRTAEAIAKLMFPSPDHSPINSPQTGQQGLGVNVNLDLGQVGAVKQPIVNNPYNPSAKPKGPRTGLTGMEDDINDLKKELEKAQEDFLGSFDLESPAKSRSQGQTPIKKDEQDLKDDDVFDTQNDEVLNPIDSSPMEDVDAAWQKIAQLKGELQNALKPYPEEFRKYLEDKFASYQKDFNDIFYHLVQFSAVLDSNKDDSAFIQDCLTQVDAFLTHSFFTSSTEMCLQEEMKTDLLVFNHFYEMINTHCKTIEKTNPQLISKLKVKLANLPVRDEIDRATQFPNAYLTEQDQLRILINHFESEEERLVKLVTQNLNQSLDDKDFHKLSKLVSENKSSLDDANKLVLRDALKKHMGQQAPTNWNDPGKIENDLKKFFNSYNNPYGHGYHKYYSGQGNADIVELHRASKARGFFARQVGLSEDEIQIPRWYHATWYNSVKSLIEAGSILVMHNKAYNGAWVANQRESSMGDCVFVLNHRIAKIDPNVVIGYEKGRVNWRGLQDEIPLAGLSSLGANHVANMYLIGYRKNVSPKAEKAQILKDLLNQAEADVQLLKDFQNQTKLEQDTMMGNLLQKTLDNKGKALPVNGKKVQILKNFQTKTPKEQAQMIADLEDFKSYKYVTVVSVDQIDYLQKEVIKLIGNPNLTEKWWGKADISQFDQQIVRQAAQAKQHM